MTAFSGNWLCLLRQVPGLQTVELRGWDFNQRDPVADVAGVMDIGSISFLHEATSPLLTNDSTTLPRATFTGTSGKLGLGKTSWISRATQLILLLSIYPCPLSFSYCLVRVRILPSRCSSVYQDVAMRWRDVALISPDFPVRIIGRIISFQSRTPRADQDNCNVDSLNRCLCTR